jgi:hypothetical protein
MILVTGFLSVACKSSGLKVAEIEESVVAVSAPKQTMTQPAETKPTPKQGTELQFQYNYLIKILVTYSLDLGKSNHISSDIMREIAKLDANYRKCYVPELDTHPDLRGTVKFLVTKHRGSNNLEIQAPTLDDITNQELIRCLGTELGNVQLSAAMVGQQAEGKITYTFDNFVGNDDETVALK